MGVMAMRLAENDDIKHLKNLWMDSFEGEEQSFCDRFFQERTDIDKIPLIDILDDDMNNNTIAAALHLQPHEFALGNGSVTGSNLVGAATNKEYRKLGYMEKLLVFSMDLMRSRGEGLCSLKPFLPAFYKKYGWVVCNKNFKYEIKIDSDNVKSDATDGQAISVIDADKVNKSTIVTLNKAYDEYAPRLYMKRSYGDWKFRIWDIAQHGGCIVQNEGGYALCTIADGGNTVSVMEYVSGDQENLNLLIGEMKKHCSNIGARNLQVNSLWDLDVLGIGSGNCDDFTMLRIVDLSLLSGKLKSDNIELDEVVYEIRDEYAPWNSGRYKVQISKGSVLFNKTEESAAHECDINEFSELLFRNYGSMIFEEY